MEGDRVQRSEPVQAAHNLGRVPRHMRVVGADSAKELFTKQALFVDHELAWSDRNR